jgi:hypothetical protein
MGSDGCSKEYLCKNQTRLPLPLLKDKLDNAMIAVHGRSILIVIKAFSGLCAKAKKPVLHYDFELRASYVGFNKPFRFKVIKATIRLFC